jgi:hypothetical protein
VQAEAEAKAAASRVVEAVEAVEAAELILAPAMAAPQASAERRVVAPVPPGAARAV